MILITLIKNYQLSVMGNYEELKATVAAVIKANGNQEITGDVLQNTLKQIITSVGMFATYEGLVNPRTNPGQPDQNIFYLATQPGTYTYFDNIVVNYGEFVVLTNSDSNWVKTVINVGTKQMVIDNSINQVLNNVFDAATIRPGYIVTSPTGAIVKWASGSAAVTQPIRIPTGATKLYVYTDQINGGVGDVNASFRNDIEDTAAFLKYVYGNGTPMDIPAGYRYVVLSVARFDGDLSHEFDYTNIRIGFNAKFRDDSIVLNPEVINDDIRYLSNDYQCFQKYKDNGDDVVFSTKGGTVQTTKASNLYRAFLTMQLFGDFDTTKPHKLAMVRRGEPTAGNYDYSIMIGVWTGTTWERAAYFIITNVDIELQNPNGICLVDKSIGSGTTFRRIQALIDYSFVPDNTTSWVGGSEQAEPNFIIKDECFYREGEYAKKTDVFDNDGYYYNSKMRFIIGGKNKFNGNAITGMYINSTTGAKYTYTGAFAAISEDIAVPENATHVATQGFLTNSSYSDISLMCCMNENHELIGGSSFNSNSIAPLLPGTKFISVPLARNDNPVPSPDWSDTMIAFATEQPAFEPFKYFIDPEYINIDDPQDLIDRITQVENDVAGLADRIDPYKWAFSGGDFPVSADGSDIKTGYVYIEETTNNFKVK